MRESTSFQCGLHDSIANSQASILNGANASLQRECFSSGLGTATRFRIVFDAMAPVGETCVAGHAVGQMHRCAELADFVQPKEVVVPLTSHLSTVTVGDLVREFCNRLTRRFPEVVAQYTVESFLIPRPSEADWGAVDLPSGRDSAMYGREVRPTYRAGRPSALPALTCVVVPATQTCDSAVTQVEERHCWSIDAAMNSEDSLDAFFDPSRPGGERRTYHLLVRWKPRTSGAACEQVTATRATWSGPENDTRSGRLLIKPKPVSHSRKRLAPLVETVFPFLQRSTYLDLLRHKEARRRGHQGTRTPRTDSRSGGSDSLGSSITSLTGREDQVIAAQQEQAYARRKMLCDDELMARIALEAGESSKFALISDLEGDAMRHVLILEGLKGDFTKNGQLAAFLRKRQFYPLDTLPLVKATPFECKENLITQANDTARLSFLFARTSETKMINRKPSKCSTVDVLPTDFRSTMRGAVMEWKKRKAKAAREHLAFAYLERGEQPPPELCSPPRSPRPVYMEDIPTDVYEDTLNLYKDGRRDIISLERKSFRSMTRTMLEALQKLAALEAHLVKQAFQEELEAAEAFDFAAYPCYDRCQTRSWGRSALQIESCVPFQCPSAVPRGDRLTRVTTESKSEGFSEFTSATTSISSRTQPNVGDVYAAIVCRGEQKTDDAMRAVELMSDYSKSQLSVRLPTHQLLSTEEKARHELQAREALGWASLMEKAGPPLRGLQITAVDLPLPPRRRA